MAHTAKKKLKSIFSPKDVFYDKIKAVARKEEL
jgi:hypothetical protein